MKKQSFLFGSVLLLISAALVKIIGALFKIPLTIMLGGTAMGYFSCAYGIFLPIYAVLGNGLGAAVAKLTAQSVARNDYDSVRRIRNISLVFFGIPSFFISFMIFVFSKPFAENILGSPQSHLAVAAISPCVFFACISSVIRGHHEGRQNMYPTAVSQVIEALAKLGLGLFGTFISINYFSKISRFLNLDATPQSLAAAFAIAGVSLSTLFGAISLLAFRSPTHTDTNKKHKENAPLRRVAGDVFSVMLPIALGALVTNLTSLVDLFTINRILENCISDNAEYFSNKYDFIKKIPPNDITGFIFGSFSGLAITIFNLVPSVTNMLSKSVLSASSKAFAKGDCNALQSTSDKAVSLTSLIAAPCAFGIAAMSQQILTLLYSSRPEEISASHTSLAYLGLSVIFLCLSSPMFSMLQGTSNAMVPVKIMLAGVGTKFIGNLIFLSIPQTAVFGAAISTLLCYILIFALSAISLKAKCGILLNAKQTVFPFVFSGVICAIAAKLSQNLYNAFLPEKYAVCAAIFTAGAVYLIMLFVMKKQGFKFSL